MSNIVRLHIHITGAVQGVGFRPFVYNLSKLLKITGSVSNTSQGVFIEAQQSQEILNKYLGSIKCDAPLVSKIDRIRFEQIDVIPNESKFSIIKSDEKGSKTVTVLPDLATCPDCLDDILNENDRRYLYPFTNCTNCGPRFSIINEIPYDRQNTEMHIFKMCKECESEYNEPSNRRFHAQPNACPSCGPQLSNNSILEAQITLINGKILALKGLGGYQLLCDAKSNPAVELLRKRKQREEKPLAIMVDSIETVNNICHISQHEIDLLTSYSAPILLLEKRKNLSVKLSKQIAPNNTHIGVMLPYTPLHHLLFSTKYLKNPLNILICTSGNIHEEPIALTNIIAEEKLQSIADEFLHNNRPIARQVDDSVIRKTKYGTQYLRKARGYTPYSISIKNDSPTILSVGAHLKNTISICNGDRIIVSQHIGDLSNTESYQAFLNIVEDLPKLYGLTPEIVACDLHPDYLSTKFANSLGLPIIKVQHHHAHIGSVMAENKTTEQILGISWDGTGLGTDNNIWGGEFLICENNIFERRGHLQEFPLPGGDLVAKEPRRSAMGLLSKLNNDYKLSSNWNESEINLINNMIDNGINSPKSSSIGRLFDGIASILNIRHQNSFEGQSAMELEYLVDKNERGYYTIPFNNNILKFEELLIQIINDKEKDINNKIISTKFHNGLVKALVNIAKESRIKNIALSGGVFQNIYLFEKSIFELKSKGFNVLVNKISPPNDGGISLGQSYIASLAYK